jgi:acetoin utilization deacetylase AcuC-like enzyme
MIIHHFGHDTAAGDYGDMGLSQGFYIELARLIKKCADEVCQGKYLVLTGGGARRDIAEYIYPEILHILAGDDLK